MGVVGGMRRVFRKMPGDKIGVHASSGLSARAGWVDIRGKQRSHEFTQRLGVGAGLDADTGTLQARHKMVGYAEGERESTGPGANTGPMRQHPN